MLVPIIVELAENHWHKILQESLIALKTILKEIDHAIEFNIPFKDIRKNMLRNQVYIYT